MNAGHKDQTYIQLLSSYLSLIIIGSAIFSFFPGLALFLFILISSYHFGEQHWEKIEFSGSNYLHFFYITAYGSLVLLLLIEFHSTEVKNIIFSITSYSLKTTNFNEVILVLIVLLIGLGIYFWNKSKDFQKNLPTELFYLLILGIIFKVGSLIWSFAVYFIFWHSIPSLFDQITFLYGEVNLHSIKEYLKAAFIYWLISIFGFLALFFFFKDYALFDAVFFSFLAAITFPHIFVIKKMYRLK